MSYHWCLVFTAQEEAEWRWVALEWGTIASKLWLLRDIHVCIHVTVLHACMVKCGCMHTRKSHLLNKLPLLWNKKMLPFDVLPYIIYTHIHTLTYSHITPHTSSHHPKPHRMDSLLRYKHPTFLLDPPTSACLTLVTMATEWSRQPHIMATSSPVLFPAAARFLPYQPDKVSDSHVRDRRGLGWYW